METGFLDWFSTDSGDVSPNNEDDASLSGSSIASECTTEFVTEVAHIPADIPRYYEISPDEVIRRIEDQAVLFISELDDDSLSFPQLRSAPANDADEDNDNDDTSLSTRSAKVICKSFTSLHQARSYTNMWLVMAFCHELLRSNRTATNREVYYHYITHFRQQRECDAAILSTALLLRVPRMALGLKASPKGWFCGCIQLVAEPQQVCAGEQPHDDAVAKSANTEADVLCDGRKLSSPHGYPITSEWLLGPQRRNFSLRATNHCICILVIEKEGIYNRLAEDRFFDEHPCILVCGKGFPDLATRACVYTLYVELGLPVWGIADCDPHGIMVLHCYMYSSNAQLGIDGGSRYGVPVYWVGLRPSQVKHIAPPDQDLPHQCLISLTEKDRRLLEGTLLRKDYRWTQMDSSNQRTEEIGKMLNDGCKVELEAFNWMGMDYFSLWLGHVFDVNTQTSKNASGIKDCLWSEEPDDDYLTWMKII